MIPPDEEITTGMFYFEDNQYNFASTWDPDHVSHFYWSRFADVACAYAYACSDPYASDNDVFFTNITPTTANETFRPNVDGYVEMGWRTLSTEEWVYLFNTRTMVNGGARYSLNITYGGVMGLVLYPDDYCGSVLVSGTQYTNDNFPTDCVFLPAAGIRDDSAVYVDNSGDYWSSSAFDSTCAYFVNFTGSFVSPDAHPSRFNGFSVRLVTDCE